MKPSNEVVARAAKLMHEIECPPYGFVLQPLEEYGILKATLWRVDVETGKEGLGYSGPVLLAPEMSDDTIVKRFFVAALSYAEHEVREAFSWRGKRVLGPHTPLEALLGIALDAEVPA